MSKSVRTIAPAETADAAYEAMRMRRIHHLVVMDEGRIVGVLSDRDLGSGSGVAVKKGAKVDDLMTSVVVTVPPDTPVRKAANLMRGRSIGCVVVTDGEKIAGIVTVADLLALLGKGKERPVVTGKRYTLKDRGPRKGRRVHGTM